MTLHEPTAPRKPPRRFWLYAPYVVVLVAAVLWSLLWLWIQAEVGSRMDRGAERLRLAGYTVEWTSRKINGYPFRVDVTLEGLRLAERSGWALAAPEIKAEAYAYKLDQWIGYASRGVTLTRPGSGAVAITGQALRASFADTGREAPRFALEGLKLTFAPQAGAKPFVINSAQHLDFHLWPAGGDTAEFLLRVDQASAPADGLLAKIAQNKPMNIAWEAKASHVSALHGGDWPATAQSWTTAGGALDVEHGMLSAGATVLNLRPGRLGVGWDGRLRGSVGLDMRQAPNVIHALADANAIDPSAADSAMSVARARAGGGPITQADLTFLAGVTAFGPVAVGPSPKVY